MIINDVSLSILNKPLIRYFVGIEKTPRQKIQCKCAYRVRSLLNACRFLSEIMMIGRKNAHNNGNEICHLSREITTRWEHHKAPHVRFAKILTNEMNLTINSEFKFISVVLECFLVWIQIILCCEDHYAQRLFYAHCTYTTRSLRNGLCFNVDSLTQCYVRVAH